MRWCEIKTQDIADGPGVRVSLFVSGCTHRCKGCFNEGTWDFAAGEPFTEETERRILDAGAKPYISGLTLLGGEPFTEETERRILEAGAKPYISGLTLLGGEPFEPVNQEGLVPLLKKWRSELPGKDVWCYTGCVLEKDLLAPSRWRTDLTDEMLSMIDVLVDGPFVESLKDISLRFRGSSNQRIVNLRNGAVLS